MMTSDSVNYACNLSSWHEILGHCNYDDVLKLESVVDGMKVMVALKNLLIAMFVC